MTKRSTGDRPARAKVGKETLADRRERLMLEISSLLAGIDATLAECASPARGLPPT
jgi:hypothetical protein